MRRTSVLALAAALVLTVLFPSGASARTEHTEFFGLYFPAGMPGTYTECPEPYEWVDPAFCVIDRGDWDPLPGGRLRIRNMTILELAMAFTEEGPEPRKTGYDIVLANANLDSTLSGPTWGTWMLYNDDDTLMFTGRFTGKFENGIPAVHFVGKGTGAYAGQHMRGEVGRVPDPWNMFGLISERSQPRDRVPVD
jgi:hypothetical protein